MARLIPHLLRFAVADSEGRLIWHGDLHQAACTMRSVFDLHCPWRAARPSRMRPRPGLPGHASAPFDLGHKRGGALRGWRRASSAGRRRPSSSVATAEPCGIAAQQCDEPIGLRPREAIEHGCRDSIVLDRRHEGGAHHLAEWRCREHVAPPTAPLQSGCGDAVLQHRNQHLRSQRGRPGGQESAATVASRACGLWSILAGSGY
jgi:hypothetical protein